MSASCCLDVHVAQPRPGQKASPPCGAGAARRGTWAPSRPRPRAPGGGRTSGAAAAGLLAPVHACRTYALVRHCWAPAPDGGATTQAAP
eukprot:CAMPEP_0198594080 /NCGR_PEP_ID=MMETSP1462-20131121/140230_1 /TAXON_ID=1333877 /ORGANISM="Brandtodinium nutriculum, Strain RCC3387" /LENGTH=88 /DNA_ID=CAMNT_0044325695 /DNA_START=55 /DNA_END=317 /DNA_ORIENTATION=+